MKKMSLILNVAVICLMVMSGAVLPEMAKSEQLRLQYSCSAQIYEAFENSRLDAFTKESGIQVDLFVASSASCVYRVMQDMTEVASTTRPIYNRHKDYGLVETPFCQDPLAVIVNKSLKIDQLTTEQLRQVFSGNVTNWKELGGPDLPVTLVIPGKDTGAYQNFSQLVMKHKDIQYDYITYTSTRVIDAIEALPAGAISFISRGAQITHPDIKILSIDGTKPGDKAYPYYQIFYLVTKGEPEGTIKLFADFIKSEKGKSIIRKRGMLPIE